MIQLDKCYCPVDQGNTCQILPNYKSELQIDFGGIKEHVLDWRQLGQVAYATAIIGIFGAISFVLMAKGMMGEEPQTELDRILGEMRHREQEEKEEIARHRLLRTRYKVKRWLAIREKKKAAAAASSSGRQRKRQSIVDMISSIPQRIKNKRGSIGYLSPDIVVTSPSVQNLRRNPVARQMTIGDAPILEEMPPEMEHKRLSQVASSDSLLSCMRPRSPGSFSLDFDFDNSSLSNCDSEMEESSYDIPTMEKSQSSSSRLFVQRMPPSSTKSQYPKESGYNRKLQHLGIRRLP